MQLLSRTRTRSLFIVIVAFAALSTRQSSADVLTSPLRLSSLENPLNVIPLRKIARKVLSMGKQSEDNVPIRIGPASANLLWQKKWKWHESTRDRKLPAGFLGGPVLSFDLPLAPLGRLFSLETRIASFRYAHARHSTQRLVLEELADPQGERQSVEAGLYLNVALSRLF
jgi:hypothetical protein